MRPKGLDTESRADLFYLWAALAALAIGGLIALHIAFTSVAKAQEVQCFTVQMIDEMAAEKFPGVETVFLEGNQAASFMSSFNSSPPPSNMVATEVYVFYFPTFARAVFFKNGCGYSIPPLKTEMVRDWIEAAKQVAS